MGRVSRPNGTLPAPGVSAGALVLECLASEPGTGMPFTLLLARLRVS